MGNHYRGECSGSCYGELYLIRFLPNWRGRSAFNPGLLGSAGTPTEQEVFIVAGQSNVRVTGVDTVPTELQTPDSGVKIWNIQNQAWETYAAGSNSDTADPGLSIYGPEGEFSRLLRAAAPGKEVYLIKYGDGNTDLETDWAPTGGAYTTATGEVVAALAALTNPAVKGILWLQGENDATDSGMAAAYEANLTAFCSQARTDWSAAGAKFIISQIAKEEPGLTFADTVRAAQVAVALAEGNAVNIFVDGFSQQVDNLHFDEAGTLSLGTSFYEAYAGTYSALPDAFEVGDWTLTPGDGKLTVGGISLPAHNDSYITDIEYRVDGGSWVSSGGIVGFDISLSNGTEYDVELRAKNAAGSGAASDVKSGTPEAAVVDPPATADMVGWWRGDSLQGTTTATAWNDKTGNGNHLTASGSPGINSSGLNGKPVATLNRATPQYFFATFNRAQPYTVVVISQCTVSDGEPHLFDGHNTANASAAYYAANGDGDMIALFAGNDLYGTELPGSWNTIQVSMNGGSSVIYVDNALDASGDPGSTGLTGFRVGNWRSTPGSPNRAFHGSIAEVIMYNKVLSGAERTELDTYVSSYYGI